MCTTIQTPAAAAPVPFGDQQLAAQLADVFHLIAECWSRGLPLPESLLDEVDRLLNLVEQNQICRGNAA